MNIKEKVLKEVEDIMINSGQTKVEMAISLTLQEVEKIIDEEIQKEKDFHYVSNLNILEKLKQKLKEK